MTLIFSSKLKKTFLFSEVRFYRTIFVLFSLIVLCGCAGEQKRPSPVTKKVDGLQTVLTDIADAYGRKDTEGFLAGIDTSSQAMRSLQDRVIQDFDHFSSAVLSLAIHRVEISDKALKTTIRWKGVWTSASDLLLLEKRGSAILFWTTSGEPKLIDVRGESPFGVFSKDQGEREIDG
ncbi:hypothetical protein JYT87_03475 [Nitrospira defluvii]|nr:hypothetical protein [Nitrospira defluvii]